MTKDAIDSEAGEIQDGREPAGGRKKTLKPRKEDHMAYYVDGFLLPLPKRNIGAYVRMSRTAGKVWRKYGALEYRECIGDDLDIKGVLPFKRAARIKKGETVVFSWIVYRSKAHRNQVNAKVLKDKTILTMMKKKSPFDVRRMAYGGFKVRVDQ